MTKTREYIEGPKARENFERGMKALFQVQKDGTPRAKNPRRNALKAVLGLLYPE
jgi:hypothetical protein